jgi:hypothetical protein
MLAGITDAGYSARSRCYQRENLDSAFIAFSMLALCKKTLE